MKCISRLPEAVEEVKRRRAERLRRVQRRLDEVERLKWQPDQQHARSLTIARGARLAIAQGQQPRSFWILTARNALTRAKRLRLGEER